MNDETTLLQAVLQREQGWDDSPELLEALLNRLPALDHGFNIFEAWITIVYQTSHLSVYHKAFSVFERILPRLIEDQVSFLEPLVRILYFDPSSMYYNPYLSSIRQNYPLASEKILIEDIVKRLLQSNKTVNDISGLLWLVVRYKSAELRQLALTKIEEIKYSCIPRIASMWHSNRNADLEKMLLGLPWQTSNIENGLRILLALKTGQFNQMPQLDTHEVEVIIGRCRDKDPVIAHNAWMFLQNLTPNHLRLVAQKWREYRAPELLSILIARDYLPHIVTNSREWITVALKLNKLAAVASLPHHHLPVLLGTLDDVDPEIVQNARLVLGQLTDPNTQTTLCQMITAHNSPTLEKIVLEAGYQPDDPQQRALFYFVTEQWERYEALDFDGRILRAAYQAAEPAFKRRLAQKIRAAGKVAYLDVIKTGQVSRPADITGEESNLLARVLQSNREWAKLWALAIDLPLRRSVGVVQTLANEGWQPASEADRLFFEELQRLAARPMLTDLKQLRRAISPSRWNDLDWPGLLAAPLSQVRTDALEALVAFRQANSGLAAPIRNTLDYLEVVLRHRLRYDVELGDASDQPRAEFDIELEYDK